ncbi:MAG: phosphotransferase [Nitriliruptorales bacterium]|nr:phosphotransferase [Nitriliruptorales bacterium]
MTGLDSGWSRDRISGRRPIEDHVGESGAELEHALLDGERPVILKTFNCDNDIMMRMTEDTGRAARLVLDGDLDRLPASVTHTVLDAWPIEGGYAMVMEDVTQGLIPLDRIPVPTSDLRRIVTAAAEVHAAYWGDPPDGLVSSRRRLEIFNPTFIEAAGEAEHRLAAWILEGWSHFFELVDVEIAAAVSAIHANPDAVAQRLATDGITLLHGDLWLQNVALLDDRVAFIDWAMATAGPVAVEWAYFLGINHWQLDCSHEEVLDLLFEQEAGRLDRGTMDVALLWGLSSYGWNKAFHAATSEDPAVRAREAADLDWWVTRARSTLETWSPA